MLDLVFDRKVSYCTAKEATATILIITRECYDKIEGVTAFSVVLRTDGWSVWLIDHTGGEYTNRKKECFAICFFSKGTDTLSRKKFSWLPRHRRCKLHT